jgi:hypothetical protein
VLGLKEAEAAGGVAAHGGLVLGGEVVETLAMEILRDFMKGRTGLRGAPALRMLALNFLPLIPVSLREIQGTMANR